MRVPTAQKKAKGLCPLTNFVQYHTICRLPKESEEAVPPKNLCRHPEEGEWALPLEKVYAGSQRKVNTLCP